MNAIPATFRALACLLCGSALVATLEADEPEPKIVGLETTLAKLETDSVPSEMRFSADGKLVAQLIVRDEQYFIAINEKMSPAYEGVTKDSLRFSPDGKRYCYGARSGDRKFVIVDGKEYPALDGCAAGMPVFSPDSAHFAYVALRGGKQCVVRDGEAGPDFEMVSSEAPLFSPDSQHLAYIAKDGDHNLVVLDGKSGERFRNIAGLSFSPDSQHFAYVAAAVTSMSIILDGREIYRDAHFVKDSLRFDGSNGLHVLTLRDGRFIRARFQLMTIPGESPDSRSPAAVRKNP